MNKEIIKNRNHKIIQDIQLFTSLLSIPTSLLIYIGTTLTVQPMTSPPTNTLQSEAPPTLTNTPYTEAPPPPTVDQSHTNTDNSYSKTIHHPPTLTHVIQLVTIATHACYSQFNFSVASWRLCGQTGTRPAPIQLGPSLGCQVMKGVKKRYSRYWVHEIINIFFFSNRIAYI